MNKIRALYSSKVFICIYISVSECFLLVYVFFYVSIQTTLFFFGGGNVRGRVDVRLSFGISAFLLYLSPSSSFLPVSFSSVSPFPLIVHNPEKLKHILDYLLYFIWCYGVLT